MTCSEFSSEFDILYNNIMSNSAPGLDEYEKSVFLTKAQYEILKNYFNPLGNKYQEGFDGSIKRQIDFSTLIKVVTPEAYYNNSYVKFDDRSQLYKMPKDILFIINEVAINKINDIERLISIVPISYEEYATKLLKPYKLPLKNQGWRIFQSIGKVDYISELIINPNSSISNYKLRYVRRPKPIILTDLDNNLTIEGYSEKLECELDPSIHQEILQRAIELAKSVYIGNIDSSIEIGKRSE
jgi:hypothetical protein